MDVDIRQLELLEALGRGDSLTAASKRLFVTQSALSQRLAALERAAGTDLFVRSGRRLEPTAAGRRWISAAHVILGEVRSAADDVSQLARPASPTVRLTSQCSTNFQWLPELLRRYERHHPDVEVRIDTGAGDRPVPALLEECVDVAIVTKLEADLERVELAPLFADQMLAVMAHDHPLADRKYLTPRDFDGAHVILYDSYDAARGARVPLPLPDGARPRRITFMPQITELIVQMVAGGSALAALPNWVVEPYLEPHNLCAVQLTRRGMGRSWYRATRRGEQPEHLAAFVALLHQQFARPAAKRPGR
ncbi:MAG: LysR family transcriptional regulator [Planctomycetaceae bacterium]|nr:LysR family transcriptional regulator [Planctomycetaceae bacterium]